jgi:predicted nucleotidyltransferase
VTGPPPRAASPRSAVSDRTARHVSSLLTHLATWAPTRADLLAVGVVGSYARGTPHADSDLDLILLTASPDRFLHQRSWIRTFGSYRSITVEDWGDVTALRVVFRSGLEVEFGIARRSWARVPPDAGTGQVVRDGLLVLHDPSRWLGRLQGVIDDPAAGSRADPSRAGSPPAIPVSHSKADAGGPTPRSQRTGEDAPSPH